MCQPLSQAKAHLIGWNFSTVSVCRLPNIQEAADDLATTQNLWRIYKLFALIGSPIAEEAETARYKLNKLLAKYRLNWNDLTGDPFRYRMCR